MGSSKEAAFGPKKRPEQNGSAGRGNAVGDRMREGVSKLFPVEIVFFEHETIKEGSRPGVAEVFPPQFRDRLSKREENRR